MHCCEAGFIVSLKSFAVIALYRHAADRPAYLPLLTSLSATMLVRVMKPLTRDCRHDARKLCEVAAPMVYMRSCSRLVCTIFPAIDVGRFVVAVGRTSLKPAVMTWATS